MKYEELLKEIDRHRWWSEEAPATIQMLAYGLNGFITQSKFFHPKLLSALIAVYKDNYVYEESSEDEKYKVYNYVFEQMKKDREFLKKCKERSDLMLKAMLIAAKDKDQFQDMGNEQLYDSYKTFMEKYEDFVSYPVGLECVDVMTSYYLEKMVRKEIGSKAKVGDVIFAMTAHENWSFMEKERMDFLKICIENYDTLSKGSTKELKEKMAEHAKKYFFALNNYAKIKDPDYRYFLDSAIEEVRRPKEELDNELVRLKKKIDNVRIKRKEILENYNFSDDMLLHFDIIRFMGEEIDRRKKNMLKATHFIVLYLREIAKRKNLDEEILKNYTKEEIRDLLVLGNKVDAGLLQKRKQCAILYTRDKEKVNWQWFYGGQAEEILERCFATTACKEVKGQVASAPMERMIGKVQIVLDVEKSDFKKGNVLVATMTRPEFVPLMRKASAIITDEGGITCHAAIVSRELSIPCIIGTKNATKMLKDGDMVDIDTKNGKVKKV